MKGPRDKRPAGKNFLGSAYLIHYLRRRHVVYAREMHAPTVIDLRLSGTLRISDAHSVSQEAFFFSAKNKGSRLVFPVNDDEQTSAEELEEVEDDDDDGGGAPRIQKPHEKVYGDQTAPQHTNSRKLDSGSRIRSNDGSSAHFSVWMTTIIIISLALLYTAT